LLYDKTREAITVEVEIEKVEKTKQEWDYSWGNSFVRNTLRFDEKLIPLSRILKVPGFENFARGRSAAWKLTQEQYRQLTGSGEDPL
jgi:hypothetical protein